MFNKKKEQKLVSKLEKRASVLNDNDLLTWTESYLYEIGVSLRGFRSDYQEEWILSAKKAAEEQLILINELSQRFLT